MAGQTLEQQRAQDAWDKSARYTKEHVNIAKGLPALIMNSGLMQVLLFRHERGEAHEEDASHLRNWLVRHLIRKEGDPGVGAFMQVLMKAKHPHYHAITAHASAWLR